MTEDLLRIEGLRTVFRSSAGDIPAVDGVSLSVPRGRTLGVLQLVTAESGRRFTPSDLALVEQLASRAALAVDNARLYRDAQAALKRKEEEQRVSETLQRVGLSMVSELASASPSE